MANMGGGGLDAGAYVGGGGDDRADISKGAGAGVGGYAAGLGLGDGGDDVVSVADTPKGGTARPGGGGGGDGVLDPPPRSSRTGGDVFAGTQKTPSGNM